MSYITYQEAIARLQPQGKAKSKGIPSITYYGDLEDETIYIFTAGKEAILSPSDDELPAVIGRFDADGVNEIPPAMAAWMQEMAREIYFKSIPLPANAKAPAKVVKAAATVERKTVQPLIKATWNQGAPYNQGLTFDGKSVIVGCNAVAIGMILLYWAKKGYRRGCTATKAYTSKTAKYKVPALEHVKVFDFDNMTYSKPSTAKQKKAVADMLRHIGYALKSDYTPNGTLAYMGDVVTVFKTYLRFGNPKRIYANKGYDVFERQIYEELAAGRPVIMAGYTVNGAGHTFLCDGYDAARDMYHINWGWSGQCNGYFRMSALDATAARAYDSNKVAIVGIGKDTHILGDVNGDGEVSITDAMAVMEAAASGKTDPKYDVNSDGKVTVEDANAIVEHVMGVQKL